MQQVQTDNMYVAYRFFQEFIGKNNLVVADEAIAPDVVAYTGLSPAAPIQGREMYKQAVSSLHKAFPDIDLKIEDIFGTGDRVVARFNAVGTHSNELMGLAATNRQIRMIETHVLRLQDGKIIENYVSANNLEFEMVFAPVLTPLVLK